MAAQPPPPLPQMEMPFGNGHAHPAAPPRQPVFRIEPEPGPQRPEDVDSALLNMAQAISRICATRVLLLLAVVTASAVWGYTVYDPTQLRIVAAGVFSFMTVWPLALLYFKRG